MIVIEGKTNIDNARLITLKHALRLECKGMTCRGRSVYSIVKEEFGLTGSKQSVLAQFEAKFAERGLPV